ncbi:Trp biosynthesis-associated membrane protein [Agromyces seonyuensis]|nr:Trp biosynthesis-associated membrane protein [Agromyces seonyuensis]
MRRAKSTSIIATLLGAGLGFLAWSQTWFTIELVPGAWSETTHAVAGEVASPALAALSLTGLALAAALGIAGPGIRVVLAVLEALLGACMVLASALSLADPLGSVARVVTDATGVAGSGTAELVDSLAPTFWPIVGIFAGAVLVAVGVFVLVTSKRWPAASRKYRAVRLEGERPAGNARDRAVDDWDELTRGDDPT